MNFRQNSLFLNGFINPSFSNTLIPNSILTNDQTHFYQPGVSLTSSSSPEDISSIDNSDVQDREKLTRRRIANRLAQRKSRERKDQVREILMLENSQLRDEISSLRGQLKILKEMGVKSDSEFMIKNEAKLDAATKELEEKRMRIFETVGNMQRDFRDTLINFTKEFASTPVELANCSIADANTFTYHSSPEL